jgi:hypothetical protein
MTLEPSTALERMWAFATAERLSSFDPTLRAGILTAA